jgi:hypothetical protein
MKRLIFLLTTIFFIPALAAQAQNHKDSGQGKANPGSASARTSKSRPQAHQPVIINLSRGFGGGGGGSRNSSSGYSRPPHEPMNLKPSYGRLQWTAPPKSWAEPQPWNPSFDKGGKGSAGGFSRPDLKAYSGPGVNAAVAVHHHPYTPGYVRQKLQKIGVISEPKLITDRSEIVHTDRLHSAIQYPRQGFDSGALHTAAISPRFFNGPIVRQQMARLDGADWRGRIQRFNSNETRVNHYYWHREYGFNYCHFIDPWGYHWWGWYIGEWFFWTRYFDARWWWYDSDFDRWCFWNEGFWWWQDPYHLGDLYCYNNDSYIPCNSANDQVVVTTPNNPDVKAYNSPDGTRTVKLIGDSQDAFLYDTANPPAFDPVYLATGVQSVLFSDTNNGKPLEIILKLSDGSFNMFDGYGNPYNLGAFNNDLAAQGETGASQPPPDSVKPSDHGKGNSGGR